MAYTRLVGVCLGGWEMTITDKARKLLWGGSGSRCAFCKQELVMEGTPRDDESIVGDECHIVSGEPNGPRYSPDFPSDELDSYPNLVLLCRVHHKVIDDQPETFTADFLRRLKEDHARWVSESLDAAASSTAESADPLIAAFQKVKSAMPDLVREMRADLSREGGEFVREFVLARKRWMMGPGTAHSFFYYYEDHDNLDGKIQILENYGFVTDVTTGNAKRYRLREEFVELLLTL
jgi:hypothetical protein